MNRIRDLANTEAKQFGIDVVDVRIKRTDLPAENSQAIYRRMQTEREREAKELRAQGAELAQRIRARADRERRVIIAEAQKEGAIIRGEGDADVSADLRRRGRPGRRFLHLLPLDAGLSRRLGRRQHQLRAVAGQRVLPLLRQPDAGAGRAGAKSRPAPAAAADRAPLPPGSDDAALKPRVDGAATPTTQPPATASSIQ